MTSYTALEVPFGINITTLTLHWCKIVIRKNPDTRRTWATHGTGRWYIGTSMEHYICHNVYVNYTISELINDTVEFLPNHTNISIYVFSWFCLSCWCIFNGGINTYQSWVIIFTHWVNSVESPKTTYNPFSIPLEKTWCNFKGGTDTTSIKFRREKTNKGGHSCNIKGGI